LLSSAVKAAELLNDEHGVSVKVINLPWLNVIDEKWLLHEIGESRLVFALDNHYLVGGQGDRVCQALAGSQVEGINVCRVGISEIPVCGTNMEVLQAHGLDSVSLAALIASKLK
jgi:transketolase